MKRMRLLIVLTVFVIVLVVQTIPIQAFPISGWTKIYEGIERADGMATSPRLMRCYALKISLANPDVWPYVSHDNGGAPYEVALQGANTFLSEHGLKVAVNASFWNTATSPDVDVFGLVVSNGTVVSAADWGGYAFCFTSEKVATIASPGTIPTGTYNAVAGCEMILTNGVKSGNNTNLNPLTGYGMTSDGKYLIMVCVDGRQPGWSDGCTQAEMAQWLADFGAYNGIIEDGGGSTTMVRQDIGVINRPCYGYVRQVAVSLGFMSTPGNTIGPDACSMNSGRIDMVYRGNMNNTYLKTWTSAGGWQAPINLGGTTYDQPAICSRMDGCLEVFQRGTTNQLYHNYNNGGGWSGWTSLGGNIFSGPGTCRRGTNNMEVVARGSDNAVWKIAWFNTTGWGPWQNLGGVTYDTPAIIARDADHMEVFYRGTNNQLYHTYWGGGYGWSAITSMGGNIASGPSVVSRNSNVMEVFARGAGGDIQHIYYDGLAWSPWLSLGGIVGKVGVCSTDANHMTTFHRSTSDRLVQKSWTAAGGWDANWTDLGTYY